MKPLELIWFENVSSFTEPVLGLGPLRISLKQFLYTLIGLALAFALMQLSLLLIPLAVLIIALAYLKPYGQDLETLLIDMVGFLFRKKSIGEVVGEGEDKKKDKKDKDKDKEKKAIARVEEAVVVATSTPAHTATATAQIHAPMQEVEGIIGRIGEVEGREGGGEEGTIPTIATTSKAAIATDNLLHYTVPNTKDFDIEITDTEYVIVTGSSTIHIERREGNATITVTIREGVVTDILVR